MPIWARSSQLVGKMPDQLQRGVIVQNGKAVETAGGVFSREFIDTDRCRFCPACALSDIGPKYSFHRAYGRVEWMLRFTHTCPDHGIPLIRIAGSWMNASDFATQLRAIVADLEAHLGAPRTNVSTRLQHYVINRVHAGKPQEIWLDGFALQAAAHFSQLLGAIMRDGPEPDLETFTEADWVEVAEIGFGIAEKGEAKVRATLQAFLGSDPPGRRIRASMFFGRLSTELLERFDQPGYSDIAKFLEDVARARYPNLVSDVPA